jgi:hypothetical protein
VCELAIHMKPLERSTVLMGEVPAGTSRQAGEPKAGAGRERWVKVR